MRSLLIWYQKKSGIFSAWACAISREKARIICCGLWYSVDLIRIWCHSLTTKSRANAKVRLPALQIQWYSLMLHSWHSCEIFCRRAWNQTFHRVEVSQIDRSEWKTAKDLADHRRREVCPPDRFCQFWISYRFWNKPDYSWKYHLFHTVTTGPSSLAPDLS